MKYNVYTELLTVLSRYVLPSSETRHRSCHSQRPYSIICATNYASPLALKWRATPGDVTVGTTAKRYTTETQTST